MTIITPVILAGGMGKRLWPLSRKSYPKQFTSLFGSKTLFQQSALRLTSSDQILFAKHITVTNSDFRFIITEQLKNVNIEPGPILIEPESKNTAPAILAAALYARAKDEDATLLISPSDHVIPDKKAFHHALTLGLREVQDGKIVTFGIHPTRPETGYGYLSLSKVSQTKAIKVNKFIEKPDLASVQSMIKAGTCLWNAGIFLFKARDIIRAYEAFAPNNLKLTKYAVETANSDLGFLRLNKEYWKELDNISIDYAIMEKAENLVAIPFLSTWSDLGDWESVWEGVAKDQTGTVSFGTAHAIDCFETLLYAESPDQQLIGLGLNNIIAIAMPDAVLIAQKNRAQDVKKVVDYLKLNNIQQAENSRMNFRPWGWFESLKLERFFQVKRIFVNPGAAISLQSHNHRSEHWIIVDGIAKVTVDKNKKLVAKGESVYIPQGTIHRLENPGKSPTVFIEVQTGSYLGEDDIVRYEDLYSRN